MTAETVEDPFADEARLHGVRYRAFDGAARDACRKWAAEDDCDRCKALVKAFDIEFNRAFLNGTGPFR